MSSAANWKSFLEEWPESIPRQGVIISCLNEAMPFRNIWTKGNTVLLERTVPDALGGRFLLIDFEIINSIKITNPLTADMVSEAGFEVPRGASLAATH